MKRYTYFLVLVLFLFSGIAGARDYTGPNHPNNGGQTGTPSPSPSLRGPCRAGTSMVDLDINNVRARLRNLGDKWWDGQNARYVVPNVENDEDAVSALFAGGIWLGALDAGGNYIVAASAYPNSDDLDFWPGPLDQSDPTSPGFTDDITCANWNRHFKCTGAEIRALREDYLADGDVDDTPGDGVLYWPAIGNEMFANKYDFALPEQSLAPFVDADGDGRYNAMMGDHPIIEVRGCEERFLYDNPVFGDEMIWWVFNDVGSGNVHSLSNGDPMFMEVQVTAFAYKTTDEINDMTFYRYKLLNKNSVRLDSTHFSVWTDPDLGCCSDDYIGCNLDTLPGKDRGRDLGIVYNRDTEDERTGCPDCSGVRGYGSRIPALGVDYFRGPLGNEDDTTQLEDIIPIIDPITLDTLGLDTIWQKKEIGLSSFLYYYRSDLAPIGGMGDPGNARQFFNYMTGTWADGTPFTYGGTGYGGAEPTMFVFPGNPDNINQWSMCHSQTGAVLNASDLRFLHTSGPFKLNPGATNELITGVVWVPDHIVGTSCVNFEPLLRADDLAQSLFDNCFKLLDGPDAPDVDVVEMSNELIVALKCTNPKRCGLAYEETEIRAPKVPGVDTSYNLEGYIVYQLKSENISVGELTDPAKARAIFQCDVKNNLTKIINWAYDDNTGAWIPEVMVDGSNQGIQNVFRVTEDQFAPTRSKTLVNHRKYYFIAVAYAYNNYKPFTIDSANYSQSKPYLLGRFNTKFSAIPHINDPEFFGVVANSKVGDGVEITRYDGQGNYGGLLDVTNYESVENEMFSQGYAGEIVYGNGTGPFKVEVHNPLRVPNSRFQLSIYDQDQADNALQNSDTISWVLRDLNGYYPDIVSQNPLHFDIDQPLLELGITLKAVNTPLPGNDPYDITGFIGGLTTYRGDPSLGGWYAGIQDFAQPLPPVTGTVREAFNFIRNLTGDEDYPLDPNQTYNNVTNGWYPMQLCDYRYYTPGGAPTERPYYTPMYIDGGPQGVNTTNAISKFLRGTGANPTPNPPATYNNLRNVNVVMTPDTSKWSRCIVVETTSPFNLWLYGATNPNGNTVKMWDLKNRPSKDKAGNVIPGSTGWSYFPGYAYDAETGERLDIFFGEASMYDGTNPIWPISNGNDMRFNPTDTMFYDADGNGQISDFSEIVAGGQHFIYVTDTTYSGCQTIRNLLTTGVPAISRKPRTFDRVNWTSMAMTATGRSMYNGIPPSEVMFQLRVNRPYNHHVGTNQNNGYPQYEFDLSGLATSYEQPTTAVSALDLMNIVPNPYYAYSDYENNETQQYIKVTNLPANCEISIYSLDGRLVRRYKRSLMNAPVYRYDFEDDTYDVNYIRDNSQIEDQIETAQIWDLKNENGVPVASGVYLVRVAVPGVGERTLKSFIINRAFDSQRF